ncbi:glutathione peroxidase [Pirellulaceae bacterium]|nr:glutathione peroxidase [Pirellulaceae bacterium]
MKKTSHGNLLAVLSTCLLAIALIPSMSNANDETNSLKFKMKTLAGEEVSLEKKYLGKVVLVVNVASKCGLTPQYKKLQELHEKYASKGLAIIGVPCNQFGGQEPGSSKEIESFCKENYGVEFDMLEKVDVNGDKACDFYKHLTSLETKPAGKGNIKWNFEKFLIDRKGNVIHRMPPTTSPDDDGLVNAIKLELVKK